MHAGEFVALRKEQTGNASGEHKLERKCEPRVLSCLIDLRSAMVGGRRGRLVAIVSTKNGRIWLSLSSGEDVHSETVFHLGGKAVLANERPSSNIGTKETKVHTPKRNVFKGDVNWQGTQRYQIELLSSERLLFLCHVVQGTDTAPLSPSYIEWLNHDNLPLN
ncbi:hypothetical protein E2C01_047447 [Portunus trituberculatus]|uniref:Uncharacterized protein n=1 Tax=Portunus trituberculatus TaxID=210409 RepID=A0A5B7G3L7_PORTR|nr:hypothetical protein [Portunus trituberculatus]